MMKSNQLGILLFVASAFVFVLSFGCVTPPQYPIVPDIQFVSMSKDTLPRGIASDSSLITFTFTDGDGDLGNKDTISDIFITDGRDGNITRGKIPYVPELGASNGIKGKIFAVIDNSCCIFPPPDTLYDGCYDVLPNHLYDKVIFSVYIKDRAGNQSNTVELPPIYIRCFE